MKKIIHLSDLHFGRINPETIPALVQAIKKIKPDLTVISGDLTQRARLREYEQVKDFLKLLPRPRLIVPGNHDVPLYNVLARLAWPRKWYKKYVAENLEPLYKDKDLIVVGLNTTRLFQVKNGHISSRQLQMIAEAFAKNPKAVKVIVTHHPFIVPEHAQQPQRPVARARRSIRQLENLKPDIFLSGHLHVSHIAHTAEKFKLKNYSSLLVQAGTATSLRYRKEANTFNVLSIAKEEITIDRYSWNMDEKIFQSLKKEKFLSSPAGWKKAPGQ